MNFDFSDNYHKINSDLAGIAFPKEAKITSVQLHPSEEHLDTRFGAVVLVAYEDGHEEEFEVITIKQITDDVAKQGFYCNVRLLNIVIIPDNCVDARIIRPAILKCLFQRGLVTED